MKAIILCAGYGTRLKPLTDTVPKPLVKIMGIPLVEYTINLLAKSGITDIFINRHHLADEFKKIQVPDGVNVKFSYEENILGTSGGILSFEKDLDEDFIVINGDVLLNLDINELLLTHRKSKKLATMVLRQHDVASATPVFKDDFHNVISIGENIDGVYKKLMFTGVHILGPDFFKLVKRTAPPSCVIKDFYLPYLASGGKVGAYVMEEEKGCFWKEIGDVAKYLDCNLWMLKSMSEFSLEGFYELFVNEYWENKTDGDTVTEVVEGLWLGENVEIDPAATLIQPVFIGPRSIIEEGSVIGPNTVINSDVVVGKNSVVTESVVMDHTNIAENTTVNKTVVSSSFKLTI